MSREQKRAVAESLKADPGLSNREHARRTGVSTTTVGSVREGMEDEGQLSKLDGRVSGELEDSGDVSQMGHLPL